MGPGELGLPMDSEDKSVELFSKSSSDDTAQDSRATLATVPLTALPNGESSRLQPVHTGIC